METWKDVIGYEGRYMVSDMGNIKSLERDEFMPWKGVSRHRKEKMIIPQEKDNDYLFVSLSDGGGRKTQKYMYIHRIVAMAFKGQIPRGYIVNHRDKNKRNNKADNLEIISQRDNCLHGQIGRKKSSKYPGVHKESKTGYWKSMIRICGKKVYLGKFESEEEAFYAYQAKLNSIEECKYMN